jgi:hypothetical protein
VSRRPVAGGASFPRSARRIVPLLLVSGCSLSNTAPDPLSPAGMVTQAHHTLEAAWAAQDWATVESILSTEVEVRLPGAVEASGPRAVIGLMRTYEVLDGEFEDLRVTPCTGVAEARGTYSLVRPGLPSEEHDWGRYLMVWDTGPDGPLLAEVRVMSRAERGKLHPTCRPVSDSLFHVRKSWVAVHLNPSRLLDQPTRDLMAGSLEGVGWVTGEAVSGEEQSGGIEVVVRFPLVREVTGGLSGYVISGRRTVLRPSEFQPRLASMRYSGIVTDFTAGVRRRGILFSAGPSFIYLSGTWSSSTDPSNSWGSWALGSTVEASYYRSQTARLGAEVRLKHRYLPEMAIPGYLGSDPPRMGIHEIGLSLGVGVKPW